MYLVKTTRFGIHNEIDKEPRVVFAVIHQGVKAGRLLGCF